MITISLAFLRRWFAHTGPTATHTTDAVIPVPEEIPPRVAVITQAATAATIEEATMNLSNVLAKLQLAEQLIPVALTLGQTLNQALPAGSAVSNVLSHVEQAVGNAYNAEQNIEHSFEQVWPLIAPSVQAVIAPTTPPAQAAS